MSIAALLMAANSASVLSQTMSPTGYGNAQALGQSIFYLYNQAQARPASCDPGFIHRTPQDSSPEGAFQFTNNGLKITTANK